MTQLLQNAAYGTALILATVLLRRVMKDRLVPGARLALWAACLFRLLTPAAPESALSLWGLSRLFQPRQTSAAPAPVTGTPQFYELPQITSAPQPAPGIPWKTVLLAVWLAVGFVLAARYALSWARTRRAVACAIPLDGSDPRYAALPKCARLREGPMEGAPLTFGTVRPTVVLSPGLKGEALECVLAHEGVHAARRDNLWHYAMALALAVHWWNPAVWLMARLLRRDIELSCDRAALQKLGEARRADYANALLTLATQDAGPAFCQTFGRKAAEERILSIMKFKKTSVIGVIFSLTLVLAVTAAFASEPKTDGGTVQFHGQAFSRSELSQGTLDWLDWYLTLSEEEQLAVSYVPNELRKDRDASTQDAYSSVKTDQTVMVSLPDKTKEIQSVFPEVDPDDVDLSELKELLAKKAADGEITQAEADQRLADTEDMLERARRGELKLFLYDNGDGESWVYGAGVFHVNGEMQSRFVDPIQVLQPLYRDENGKLVPVDPDTVTSGYVLDPRDISEYNVELPTFTEDGGSVSADGGVVGRMGSRFYSYEIFTGSDAASGGLVGSAGADDAAPAPVPSSAPSGAPARLNAPAAPSTSCGVEGCTETRYHAHNEGRTILLSDPCPVEGCAILGNHIHGDVCYSCNGAGHDGGVCDGSCYTYAAPTGAHHSESHHSSHH